MLAAGLVVAYGYFSEIFSAFYSMDRFELAVTLRRMTGAYAWTFWGTILCNVLSIQLLWSARVRRNHAALFVIALLVLIGMWLERFMLIVTSLYQDFVPSSWGMFYPTFWDIAFLAGSAGAIPSDVPVVRAPAACGFNVRAAQTRAQRGGRIEMNGSQPHGVLVEFISAEQLLGAVWRVRREQPNCAIRGVLPVRGGRSG
jgi:hypothetical protein